MLWKIYVREPSYVSDSQDCAAECYSDGVVALGWSDVGDLRGVERKEIAKRVGKHYRGDTKSEKSNAVGCLWRFYNEMKVNDMVICPDRKANTYYVGKIFDNDAIFEKVSIGGLAFYHRRRVKWLRVLSAREASAIWIHGDFGGLQTLSQIKTGERSLGRYIKKRPKPRPPEVEQQTDNDYLAHRPDMEWGKAVEKRAMAWLREAKMNPVDVSRKNLGWDISCGDHKYEVKGRKVSKSLVRISPNEWKAAKKHGASYTVLIFTARTQSELDRAKPKKIVDPRNTCAWRRRVLYEYVLEA